MEGSDTGIPALDIYFLLSDSQIGVYYLARDLSFNAEKCTDDNSFLSQPS